MDQFKVSGRGEALLAKLLIKKVFEGPGRKRMKYNESPKWMRNNFPLRDRVPFCLFREERWNERNKMVIKGAEVIGFINDFEAFPKKYGNSRWVSRHYSTTLHLKKVLYTDAQRPNRKPTFHSYLREIVTWGKAWVLWTPSSVCTLFRNYLDRPKQQGTKPR